MYIIVTYILGLNKTSLGTNGYNMTSSSSYSPAAPNVANSYCVTASSSSSLYDEDEKMIDAAAADYDRHTIGCLTAYYPLKTP